MPDFYAQLLEWRRNENSSHGLSKIAHNFYAATAAYLEETRRAYETELRSDPSSARGELARRTFERAVQAARDIVEARARKVVQLALSASIGASADLPNSLSEDRALFDRVLATLR